MISVVLFALSVLLASVSGWGACRTGSDLFTGQTFNRDRCYYGLQCVDRPTAPPSPLCSDYQYRCNPSSCPSTYKLNSTAYLSSPVSTGGNRCNNVSGSCNLSVNGSDACYYMYSCDTQLEADSANCATNPSSPGCAQDTTYHCQNRSS